MLNTDSEYGPMVGRASNAVKSDVQYAEHTFILLADYCFCYDNDLV